MHPAGLRHTAFASSFLFFFCFYFCSAGFIAKSETPRPFRCLTVHPWHDLQPLCFFPYVISDHGVRGLVSIGRTRSCYWTLLLVFSPPRLHVHGIRNEAKREEKADRMRAGCMGTVLARAKGMKIN